MNIEDFKIAALSQNLLNVPNFWTFNSIQSNITNFSVATTSPNIKIYWGDDKPPTITSSQTSVSHVYS